MTYSEVCVLNVCVDEYTLKIMILVACIQDLQIDVDALKDENMTLKAKLEVHQAAMCEQLVIQFNICTSCICIVFYHMGMRLADVFIIGDIMRTQSCVGHR